MNIQKVLFSYFTSQEGQDLADVIRQQNQTVHANLDAFTNPIHLPEVDRAETVTGALTRGISQFLVGYLTAYRIIRPITQIGSLVKGATAGVIADSTVMAPNEERLSNLIQSFPKLRNCITEYLQAKPDDSEAEGRLKNALEGLIVGLVAEPFMRSLRLLKYARIRLPIVEVRTKRHYELESVKLENNGEYSGKLVAKELNNTTTIGNKIENSNYVGKKTINIIRPNTLSELNFDLVSKGFQLKSISGSGYITYKHPDGRIVTIKPTGEVIPTKPKIAKNGKKYNERTDYEFNRLEDQSHSTNYFIDRDK